MEFGFAVDLGGCVLAGFGVAWIVWSVGAAVRLFISILVPGKRVEHI